MEILLVPLIVGFPFLVISIVSFLDCHRFSVVALFFMFLGKSFENINCVVLSNDPMVYQYEFAVSILIFFISVFLFITRPFHRRCVFIYLPLSSNVRFDGRRDSNSGRDVSIVECAVDGTM